MRQKYFLVLGCVLILGFSGCGVSKEDYENKKAELERAKQDMGKLENQMKEKDAKITELEKGKEKDAERLAALKQEIETLQKKSEDMSGTKAKELEKYESALDKLRSQNTSFQQQLAEKTESLSQLRGLLSQKEKSLGEIQALLHEKTGALADMQSQLDKFQMSALGTTSELNNLKTLVNSKDNALKQKDAQITAKDSELQEKNSQIETLMKQLDALKKGGMPGLGGAGGLLQR